MCITMHRPNMKSKRSLLYLTPLRYCCPVSSGSGNGWPIIIFVRRVMFTKPQLPSGLKLESETIVEYNPDFEADAPLSEREQLVLDLLAKEPEQCVTKLEKESGLKNILTVIKSLLDKEALFVKEELRRTYKPKRKPGSGWWQTLPVKRISGVSLTSWSALRNSWRC